MRHRLLRLALCLLLALPQAGWGDAWAQSSGGYSRPGGSLGASSGSRRPSYGGSSGGYSRPSSRPSVYGGGYGSGGDRAVSRRSSADALRQYRLPSPSPAPSPGWSDGPRRPSAAWGTGSGWGSGRTRLAPAPVPPTAYGWAQPGRSFGVFDGLLLWGLLNSLSSPTSTRFFQDNRDDPGYRQWRAEADRAAASDAELRARLDALDQRMAQGDTTATTGKPPPLPDSSAASPEGGGSLVYIVLFVGIALFALLWLWRRRRAAVPAAAAMPTPRGSNASRFRVGMTFPVDPAPFALAAGSTKVRPPEGDMVNVEAIGVLADGPVGLHRLYLPGRSAFFQLHLGADGRPDECRYFSRIDEVTPASREEWAAWLDPAQGMIGWPQFQTKDGRLYDRAWSPGPNRSAPRGVTETIEDLTGTTTRSLGIMLYAAPSNAAPPAPATEYVLVAAVDAAGEAFVEIHAGIDVNPASLSLPAVSPS